MKLPRNGQQFLKMATSTELFDDLKLYITTDKFFIEAVSEKKLLVIDRVSQDISLQVNSGQIPPAVTSKPICGIIGTIHLLSGPYLVVITKKRQVGSINGQKIWLITDTEVMSYSRTLLHLTEKQISENRLYLSMIEQVLSTPNLYFSYSYDITHTLQRLHSTTPQFLEMPVFQRADTRFVWNGHLLRELANYPELQRFCLPILHGFVSVSPCSLNGKSFTWTIVSRRCCHRAGTRLFTRGIDSEGNVANFVETEQIIESSGDRSSFVQTRGSIPLFWSQLPNLRYKPKPTLIPSLDNEEAFKKHIDAQMLQYGKQVLVNLIDHHGAEQSLEHAFSEIVNNFGNSNVRYEAFDFHAECSRMRWDRLSILLARLAHEQDELGYFLLARDGTLASLQEGVFRTNCVDCLDRTNVVQSLLARRSLTQVLQKLNILRPGQLVEDQTSFEALFKSVWADNADVISIEYSGTGALKTDFTRTGKRTKWGLLRDGYNSLVRYYKNNLTDGYRQDAIDLFLGHYIIEPGEGVSKPCPLEVEKGWKYVTFPSVLLVAIAMFCASVVTPYEYCTETLLYLLFWGSMVGATSSIILYYGKEFVDVPRLSAAPVSYSNVHL